MDVHLPHVRRAAAWLAAGTLVTLLAPALGDANRGSRLQRLRASGAAIAADRQSAVLELYALESRLAAARGQAASAQRSLIAVRRQRAELAIQLGVARDGMRVSQLRLEKRLRLLYEEGEVDPIEILFSAKSFDDALSTLDNIGAAASLDRRVLAQLREARSTLATLDRGLREREAALARLRAQASGTASSLAAARAERTAYVGRLLRQQRATGAKVDALEQQARRAARRTTRLRAEAATPQAARVATSNASTPLGPSVGPAPAPGTPEPAPAPDAAPPPAPAPAPAPDGTRTLTVVATGYSINGHTATGLPTGWGVAAVDPNVIALGTRITVPGYGEAVAADVGSGIRGAEIDLWFPTVAGALAWGRRTVTIVLH